MTNERETIREWGKGMWAPFVRQARLPRLRGGTVEERLQRLEDEATITDRFRQYHYFYDAADIDGVVSCFTDNAVQINGRGTFVGRDQIRTNYEYLTSTQRLAIHHGSNVIVRFDPAHPTRSAFLASMFIAAYVGFTGDSANIGGTYVLRLVKEGEEWLIAEHRITYSYREPFTMESRMLKGNPPTPDEPLSTRDLIEERYQLA